MVRFTLKECKKNPDRRKLLGLESVDLVMIYPPPPLYAHYTLAQGLFPAGTPGNGVPKVILTVGTAFPRTK